MLSSDNIDRHHAPIRIWRRAKIQLAKRRLRLASEDEMDFAGKRVLITGSTAGIGRATAEMFHAAGARVAISGRTDEAVRRTIAELGGTRLVAAPGNVATVGGCESVLATAIEGLGGLDCLVNNAGIAPLSRLADVTEAHWDEVIGANLRSAMFCTKAALKALRASKGNIIMVSFTGALMAGPTENFVYAVSKAGLIGMSRSLALELAVDNVRVNCVCPGFIATSGTHAKNDATNGSIERFVQASTPLGRLGTMRECAASIVYLASDDAGYCTGSTLVNDGGCYANASWGTRT
jgi:3-oxoacyl-[acyl-carrier protein] reductase